MCKILPFPPFCKEQIVGFIIETSKDGYCVLCGTPGDSSLDIVVCKKCRIDKNVVRCARCGEVYVVKDAAFEVHKGIDDLSFLNLDESGPIGIVVGACLRCDPLQLLTKVAHNVLEYEDAPIAVPKILDDERCLSQEEINALLKDMTDYERKKNEVNTVSQVNENPALINKPSMIETPSKRD